jgi:hypothetical protein
MLTVRTGAYYKHIKRTKTDNGWRDLDIHPSLSAMLSSFIGGRREGFIFVSMVGIIDIGKSASRQRSVGYP